MAAFMSGGHWINSCFLMISLGCEVSFHINERMVFAALWGQQGRELAWVTRAKLQ